MRFRIRRRTWAAVMVALAKGVDGTLRAVS